MVKLQIFFFLNFHPYQKGIWVQFDLSILFKWVGEKPPTCYIFTFIHRSLHIFRHWMKVNHLRELARDLGISLKLTAKFAPENRLNPTGKRESIPTIHWCYVNFREGNSFLYQHPSPWFVMAFFTWNPSMWSKQKLVDVRNYEIWDICVDGLAWKGKLIFSRKKIRSLASQTFKISF